jgi:hypothetical protein
MHKGNKIMKLVNKLVVVAAAGAALGLSGMQSAKAASFEMVTNGEFEETNFSKDWTITTSVPGWKTTGNGEFELWNQGRIGSPAMGSDGLGTGKHLETNLDYNETISQTFKLLDNIKTSAMFSFDAWSRAGGTGMVSVFGSQSGSLLSEAISLNGQNWTQNLYKLTVKAGEDITVAFKGNLNDSIKSPHIDQVSFKVESLKSVESASVPEPASMLGLIALGAWGTTIKRKKNQEA